MRLLFCSRLFAPHIGGAESLLGDLARQAHRRGHDVTVLTSRTSPALAAHDTSDGVEIVRVTYRPSSVTGMVRLWAAVRALLKRDIDVVCIGVAGIEILPILFWRRFRRFRLVVYLHGGELRSYIRVSPVMRWALRAALRQCDSAIAVSRELSDEAIRFEPTVRSRIETIPNGVDVAAFASAEPYRHTRPYVLFAGRLHPVKGVETLVDAFGRVAATMSDLDLLIAGDGPSREALRARADACGIGARVVFLGSRSRGDVASLLRGCELAVLPSRAEGCSMFLLEAQAAGRLVIASRVKGNVETIRDGINGELVDADDPAALALRIAAHAQGSPERARIEAELQRAPPAGIADVADQHLRAYSGESRRLSIGVVSAFFDHDQDNSGVSSYYGTLCTALASLGHDVHLVTSADQGDPPSLDRLVITRVGTARRELVPVTTDRSRVAAARRSLARLRFAWGAWRTVRAIDRSSGLDIVVAPELFAPGLFVSFAMKNKLVTRVHTPTVFGDRYNGAKSPAVSRLAGWPEKIQTLRSRAVSAASDRLIRAVADEWKVPSSRMTRLPNGIRIDWTRALAAEQPREIDGEYLLYFGRLERRKGVHVLTEALGDVLVRHPSLTAVFVGRDWGLRSEVLASTAYATGRVKVLDTMARPRLFGVIQHARLVVLPSLFENVSNAALESMALGRPTIGTRRTAFEELIEDGVNGWLTDPGDPAALAGTITACLSRSDLEQIGARALASVRQYDGLEVGRQQVAFLRRAAFGGGGRRPGGTA